MIAQIGIASFGLDMLCQNDWAAIVHDGTFAEIEALNFLQKHDGVDEDTGTDRNPGHAIHPGSRQLPLFDDGVVRQNDTGTGVGADPRTYGEGDTELAGKVGTHFTLPGISPERVDNDRGTHIVVPLGTLARNTPLHVFSRQTEFILAGTSEMRNCMSSARNAPALTFLQEARVGRLATVDPRGFPSVVPFCFALLDDPEPTIVSVLDEKPKQVPDAELARVRNILRHPEVGFVVDDYNDDWSRLIFVQGKGIARLVEASDPIHAHALIALRAKYPQYRAMVLTHRPIIAIEDLRFHSWRGDDRPIDSDPSRSSEVN